MGYINLLIKLVFYRGKNEVNKSWKDSVSFSNNYMYNWCYNVYKI